VGRKNVRGGLPGPRSAGGRLVALVRLYKLCAEKKKRQNGSLDTHGFDALSRKPAASIRARRSGPKKLIVSVEDFVEQAEYGSFALVGSGKLGERLSLFQGRRFFLDGGSFLHRALSIACPSSSPFTKAPVSRLSAVFD